ncbi:oxidoreductase [Lentzea sp. NBRC 105346]|uniref:Gfo/Idh/MocA family protein n=1 Tax=Lentzea sp. NBRC 105346 TaxID=3032205 RepID=UPI0024A4C551|nr:Gfo/Idh/MocA family oxidoreductase [Lentzea sp. NBRC 105346]GLZ36312.1 oxidoreductase [Lentzea sp. NBRC 105346]
MKLRVGVIGCANIARRNTIPALAADPRVSLVAVASRTFDRALEFARQFGCEAVVGYDAMLDRIDIDAVYVPLPPALHKEWIGKAIAAGKHVLAEKPLAVCAADAHELVSASRNGERVLLENFAFLYHSQHAAVRRMIEDDVIGSVRSLTVEFGFPPLPPRDIRYQLELGGGALLDAGVYGLRAASMFLGPSVRVVGSSLRMDRALGVDLGGSVLLENSSGVTATALFGFDRSYRCAYTLWGSKGRLTLDRAFTPPPGHRSVVRIERQDVVEERLLPADTQFANLISAFAQTALGLDELLPPASDIVRQAELIDAARA